MLTKQCFTIHFTVHNWCFTQFVAIYCSQRGPNGAEVFTTWWQVSALLQRGEELHSHTGVNQGVRTVALLNSRQEHAFILFDFCSSLQSALSLSQSLLFVFLLFTFYTSQHNRMCKPTNKKKKLKIVDTDLDFQTLKAFRMLLLKTDGSRKKKEWKSISF